MKISNLLSERTKESPSYATVKSQEYMIRAGFIKQVTSGIYSFLPACQRVSLKIQNIIREEMNKIDGQEVLFPVVMPRELWEESGRYASIGNEMARFKDRTGHEMLLGMTHEEAAVHLARNTVKSYENLPFMIYQIQTKFRDEARSRAGLIRVREFTMKDGYSFHTSQEDLEAYYQRVYDAYFKIFKRIGMNNVIAVGSDTGMMGGKVAHEYMLLTDIGEDTIAICPHCGYKANMEVAKGILSHDKKECSGALEEVLTKDAKTIDEICKFLNIMPSQTIKAVCYALVGNNTEIVVVFVRGDKEVNEAKLKNYLGKEIAATDLENTGFVKGNIGPINLNVNSAIILFDESLKGETGMVCGANREEYHLKNVDTQRDLKNVTFVDVTKVTEGDGCANCENGNLTLKRGIEVGNIFQLGTKYTKSMGMKVHDEKGEDLTPIMGCYGIGVGRAIASVAEESSDEKGLIWPMSIAPWQVYLCPLRLDNEEVKNQANSLYKRLTESGIETIFDDRNVSAGIKFADSELMGMPLRLVVSPRSLENNQCELTIRATGEKIMISMDNALEVVKKQILEQMNNISN